MLVVDKLSVNFGNKDVIKQLSFCVTSPQLIIICGHNGSGKSTLLRAIADKIAFHGLIKLTDNDIGFLEQSNVLNFPVKVKDLLIMGKYRSKHFLEPYTEKDMQDVARVARMFSKEFDLEDEFQHLSGGQKQMVWIAQTALQDVSIYLFDEPTQYLDIKNRNIVFDFFEQQVHEHKKLILCVTHDLEALRNRKGMILNLSMKNPELQPLSSQVVDQHLEFLTNH